MKQPEQFNGTLCPAAAGKRPGFDGAVLASHQFRVLKAMEAKG
jgi:hypothetical protein